MAYTEEEVNCVYDLTGGACFYCAKRLAFRNYGIVGNHGAWEIDHFVPLASHGAHQPYNWVPACVDCNTRKADLLPWEFDPTRFRVSGRDPAGYM